MVKRRAGRPSLIRRQRLAWGMAHCCRGDHITSPDGVLRRLHLLGITRVLVCDELSNGVAAYAWQHYSGIVHFRRNEKGLPSDRRHQSPGHTKTPDGIPFRLIAGASTKAYQPKFISVETWSTSLTSRLSTGPGGRILRRRNCASCHKEAFATRARRRSPRGEASSPTYGIPAVPAVELRLHTQSDIVESSLRTASSSPICQGEIFARSLGRLN